MLSPPNQGAELAIAFRDWPLFDVIAGEAAASLSLDDRGILDELGPIPLETGVIGGDQHRSWFDLGLINGPHDGTVSVDKMRLDGMKDFLVVPETHVSIRRSPQVHEQILSFLATGMFQPLSAIAHSDG